LVDVRNSFCLLFKLSQVSKLFPFFLLAAFQHWLPHLFLMRSSVLLPSNFHVFSVFASHWCFILTFPLAWCHQKRPLTTGGTGLCLQMFMWYTPALVCVRVSNFFVCVVSRTPSFFAGLVSPFIIDLPELNLATPCYGNSLVNCVFLFCLDAESVFLCSFPLVHFLPVLEDIRPFHDSDVLSCSLTEVPCLVVLRMAWCPQWPSLPGCWPPP